MLPQKSQPTVADDVRRVPSDRGRELNNAYVHGVCRRCDLHQTFTQGDDPRQNGRVKTFHARLEARKRALLNATSASFQDWPSTPCAQAGLVCGLVSYELWDRDLLCDRAQDAEILVPSSETRKGHVARTVGGNVLHTTALFRGALHVAPQPVVPAFASCLASEYKSSARSFV